MHGRNKPTVPIEPSETYHRSNYRPKPRETLGNHPTMHSRQSFSTMKVTNFDNIRTPKSCAIFVQQNSTFGQKDAIKVKGKGWDSTNSDLTRYKLSQEEVMRRKQIRSTPVNTGPINRSSIRKSKQKQQQRSAALTRRGRRLHVTTKEMLLGCQQVETRNNAH